MARKRTPAVLLLSVPSTVRPSGRAGDRPRPLLALVAEAAPDDPRPHGGVHLAVLREELHGGSKARLGVEDHVQPEGDPLYVAEAPWSVAEWAVALRFDNPRGTALVLLLSDTPLRVLGLQTP